MVRTVPRRDCQAGRTAHVRLPPAPMSQIPEPAKENVSQPAPRGVWARLADLQSQFRRIVGFSCFPNAQRERCELTGERDAGEFFSHATLDHGEVEILQGACVAGGRRGCTLEDALEDAVVVAIQAPGHGTATSAHRSTIHDRVVRARVRHDREAAVAP